MPNALRSQSRTRKLAVALWIGAAVVPFAMLSFSYPQWLLASQGPCIATGNEWWYQAGRLAGAAVIIAVAVLAVLGIREGGAARTAGVVTLVLAATSFFASALASYLLFHVSSGLCT